MGNQDQILAAHKSEQHEGLALGISNLEKSLGELREPLKILHSNVSTLETHVFQFSKEIGITKDKQAAFQRNLDILARQFGVALGAYQEFPGVDLRERKPNSSEGGSTSLDTSGVEEASAIA